MTIETSATAGTTSPLPLRAESLRGLCGGAVQLPRDPGYDEARMPWNVAFDQRPAATRDTFTPSHAGPKAEDLSSRVGSAAPVSKGRSS